MKKIAVTAIALVLVLVAAGVGGLLWLDGERLATLAGRYFERRAGVEVRMEHVTRTFDIAPRVEVAGLVVREPSYDRPLLEVDRAAFTIDLSTLLFNPIELRDIRVEDADLVLPVDDGGVQYWGRTIEDLLNRLKSAGIVIDGFAVRNLAVHAPHSEGTGEARMRVASIEGTMPRVERLAFEATDVESNVDITAPTAIRGNLDLETLRLSHDPDATQSVIVESRGRIAGRALSLTVQSGNPLVGVFGARHPLDARLEIGDSSAEAHGSVSRGADRHLIAEVVLDVDALGAFPPWRADFGLSDPGAGWLIEDLAARWNDVDLEGTLRIERREPRPHVAAEVVLTGWDWPRRSEAAPSDSDETDAGTQRASAPDDASTSPVSNVTDWLVRVDADLELAGRDLSLYGLDVTETDLAVSLENGRLEAAPLELRLLGGRIDGSLVLSERSDPPALDIDLSLDRLSTATLLEALGIEREARGGFEGTIELSMSGDEIGSALDTATGQLTLIMDGGRLSETLAQLADQDLAAAVLGSFGGTDTTEIRCAILDFEGNAGVLEARTLIIDTGEVKLVGDGEVDLGQRVLDIVVHPHAKDFSLLSAGAPVRIDGPLTDPEVSTDVAEAALSLLTPIEIGNTENAACRSLIEQANSNEIVA